ncbi:MAG: S-layer homology domain-containing protein [Clostridia bacterium]|nr:S-layer homology domain-containing protein [Clostridia bacterium]
MKKIIFLILSITLLLTVFSFNAYAQEDDMSETLLTDLGIVPADADLSTNVTRGEFALYLSKALKVDSLGVCDIPFEDVRENSEYYESVCGLYTWGVISPAQKFRPDDPLKRDEALKMTVTALGYDYIATEMGGWPNGYMSTAIKIDLPIPGSDVLKMSEVCELLYASLHTKLPKMTITGSGAIIHLEKGDTLLGVMWNLNLISDVVYDVQFYGFNRPDGTGEGRVGIGDMVLYSNGFNTDSLFGHNVDAYYDSSYKLQSVYSHKETDNNVKTIYSTQNIQLNNNTYTYETADGKIKELSFANDALIIYNGKRSGYISENMVPERGSVDLIFGSGSVAKAVVIYAYDEYIVRGVSAQDRLISDKLVSGRSFFFDEDNMIISYRNQEGAPCSFENIFENDILWIAKSLDSTIADVVICRDIIIGELDGIASGYITIDSGEYNITDAAMAAIGKDVYLGEIITGYINPDGVIIYIQKQGNNEYSVGYLIQSMYKKQGLTTTLAIKLLTESGKIVTYDVAEVLSVNGKAYKGGAEAIYVSIPKDPAQTESILAGLVTYKLNEERKLTAVNYANDVMSSDSNISGLFKTGFISKNYGSSADRYIQYRNNQKTITSRGISRLFVPTSARLFQVPASEDVGDAEDSDYKVLNMSSMNGSYFLNRDLTGYSLAPNNDMADYVLATFRLTDAGESVSSRSQLYMVAGVSLSLDSEGCEAAKLIVKNPSGDESFVYSEDLNYFQNLGLKKGDLVKLSTDNKNYVLGLQIFYRSGDKKLSNVTTMSDNKYSSLRGDESVLSDNPGMDYLPESMILGGTLYSKGTETIKLLSFSTLPENYNNQTLFPQYIGSFSILKYDSASDEISSVKLDELKSYEDFATSCNTVVMETSAAVLKAIYVYE